MGTISKAIAAGVGGGVSGATVGAVVLPDGSPWYAYVLMAAVTTIVPLIFTYFAPANKPS
jgi:hypothetical protein